MTAKSTDRSQNLELLNEWLCLFLRMEIVYQDLRKMFDAAPECQVNTLTNDIFSAYTKLVKEKVGDKDDWLDWFLYENDAGRKGMVAKSSNWKKVRNIRNIENLLDLIENKPDNKV